MMGWPLGIVSTRGISPAQMASLLGEALHVACISSLVYSVFLTETAPWWGSRPPVVLDTSSVGVKQPDLVGPTKRRRTGAVGIRRT
jgi:hypothetical protein